jgi:hypothetical protein
MTDEVQEIREVTEEQAPEAEAEETTTDEIGEQTAAESEEIIESDDPASEAESSEEDEGESEGV